MLSLHYTLLFLLLLPHTHQSAGDRSPLYQARLAKCIHTKACPQKPVLWSCADDCKYTTMQNLEKEREGEGKYPWQYNGKWPFIRIAGIQEPASVVFSIANLWAHAR